MQTYVMLAGIVLAAIFQRMNAYKANNTMLVKCAMVVAGAALYLPVSHPWGGGPTFFQWLDSAALWGAALPGVASLIAIHPEMQTNSK